VLDFLHELAEALCHRVLLAIGAEAGVVRADVDLASFDDVPPVIQGVSYCEEFSFLRRIALLRLGELFSTRKL